MELVVPPSLADRVHFAHGVLRFRRDPLGRVARRVAAVGAALPFQSLSPLGEVQVSKDGVFVGWGRRQIPHVGQALRLVGDPGHPANLFVNGAAEPLLYAALQPPGDLPWTTADVLWLGRSAALLLGIPWWVEWDRKGWDRWNRDPILRGRTALDIALERSERDHTMLHTYRLEEPPGSVALDAAEYTLRGNTFQPLRLRMEATQLRSTSWTIAWESIHGVATVFEHEYGRHRPTGFLKVSFYDRVLDLLVVPEVTEIEAVWLRWLEDAVRTRCRQYVRPEGSAADIPPPLQSLRSG